MLWEVQTWRTSSGSFTLLAASFFSDETQIKGCFVFTQFDWKPSSCFRVHLQRSDGISLLTPYAHNYLCTFISTCSWQGTPLSSELSGIGRWRRHKKSLTSVQDSARVTRGSRSIALYLLPLSPSDSCIYVSCGEGDCVSDTLLICISVWGIKPLLNVFVCNHIIVDSFVWNVILHITLVSNWIELNSDNTVTLLRLMTQWFTRQGTFTGKWILVIVPLNNENNNLYIDPQSPAAEALFLL